MPSVAHPLAQRNEVVAAVIAIEEAAKDSAAFPVVPSALPRVFRALAEDAVRATPVGLTADQIERATGIGETKTRNYLNEIPGILAIYAPRTVALVRLKSEGKGHAYIYRLTPA